MINAVVQFPDGDDDDGLKVGKRIIVVNVSEADEIRITIKMNHEITGEISIAASTLAQIILDRNNKVQPVEENREGAINVGDGNLGGSYDLTANRSVSSEELLNASRIKRR